MFIINKSFFVVKTLKGSCCSESLSLVLNI